MSMSTFTGKALAGAVDIQDSQFENGSGVVNQAALIAAGLTSKGYHVSATGDRTPTGPIPETMVWYGGPPPPGPRRLDQSGLEAAQSVHEFRSKPGHHGLQPSEVTPGALVHCPDLARDSP